MANDFLIHVNTSGVNIIPTVSCKFHGHVSLCVVNVYMVSLSVAVDVGSSNPDPTTQSQPGTHRWKPNLTGESARELNTIGIQGNDMR